MKNIKLAILLLGGTIIRKSENILYIVLFLNLSSCTLSNKFSFGKENLFSETGFIFINIQDSLKKESYDIIFDNSTSLKSKSIVLNNIPKFYKVYKNDNIYKNNIMPLTPLNTYIITHSGGDRGPYRIIVKTDKMGYFVVYN